MSALIPSAPPPQQSAERVLAINQIAPNPWQPRGRFDDEKLSELVESIRAQGVLQPLLVRRSADGYELIAGERRLRAARLAGLEMVPAVVRDLSDHEALEIALVENLQREDLTALEEAAGYQRLIDEFGLTQEAVASRMGKSRPAVANTLRLLQLPDAVREEMRSGRLNAGQARALLGLSSAAEQISLAREAVRRGLSVRQVEAQIRFRTRPRPAKSSTANLHVAEVEKQLSRSLGTRVRLLGRGARGKIVIEFFSEDERERLIVRLRDGKRL